MRVTFAKRATSDAEDTHYVYDWRLEQESRMREAKGKGMTDAQVIDFVNGCKVHIYRVEGFTWLTLEQIIQPMSFLLIDLEAGSSRVKWVNNSR